MGTNFHTAWSTATAFKPADMNPALASLDQGLTYLKNLIIHSDGVITYTSGTGVLDWTGTLRIVFNRSDGQAIENTVATGNITLADNEFAYVDLNETDGTVLTMQKAAVTTASASNFIAFNRLLMGYRNTTSNEYFGVNLHLVGAAGGGASPLTTKGDLYAYDSADARLPVGANGEVLVADSAPGIGLNWKKLTKQFTFTVSNETDGFDLDIVPLAIAPIDKAITINKVHIAVLGSSTPTLAINIEERASGSLNSAGTDIFSIEEIAPAGGLSIVSFANSNIASGAHLVLAVSNLASGGVVDYLTGIIEYTED